MLPPAVVVGDGRTAVRLELVPLGRDLLLLISGGQAHVGAVAVARPAGEGGSAGTVVVPPHKEGPLAESCAALVAAAAGCTCAAVAGIHQDAASAAEIAAICANVDEGARQLAGALAQRRRRGAPP
jgi:hypothetical protein